MDSMMFGSIAHGMSTEIGMERKIPPPTPVKFPNCKPASTAKLRSPVDHVPLANLLRRIQRPGDVKIKHLEALGLHLISDAPPKDIIPETCYLPLETWKSVPIEELEAVDRLSVRKLNNGRDSPGAKTYSERVRELSIPNAAAFRTIRRLPAIPGEPPTRLGNAYEFFKNLELFANFWVDTSQPAEAPNVNVPAPAQPPESDPTSQTPSQPPVSQGAYYGRTGTGSQTPPDSRAALLSSLVKLVAYDFGCNVSHPRIEPRLFISAASLSPTSKSRPNVSFPSNISFIYRTPTDRSSARSGIVEGPLAALSSRPATGFETETDSLLDLCRETIAFLTAAQQRSRDGKTERRPDEDAWWCHKPRWGGGSGGPIGREEAGTPVSENDLTPGPSPSKKSRKTMSLYDNYRMVRPPSSTWDRKTRYLSIGKAPGTRFDDVFLLSSVNHHVSVVRVRVPMGLLEALDGVNGEGREECVMWRSKWYDMFLAENRIEAMGCIWGMMAYMMRAIENDIDMA